MQFHTPISAVMELVNDLADAPDAPGARFAAETAVSLLQPWAPHVTEELWQRLGHERLWEQPWPEADPALLARETFQLVVQVNGKVRDRMEVPADLPEEELVERAKGSEKVQAHLDGKEIRQTIVVPGQARQPGRRLVAAARVVVLGAGFGGLELRDHALGGARRRHRRDADRQGRRVRLRLLEARRDVRARRRSTRCGCRTASSSSPACASLQETVTAIDPEARRVTTDAGVHEADVLVVALGADYDFDATPGLAEGGNEFYSVAGAARLRDVLPDVLARAARSSASAARRSSARRRRASARCCCTTS